VNPAKDNSFTVVSRHVDAPPERVFAVVSDAWLIPVWLVGAAHIRDVDSEWPSVGSKLHHSIGAWPVLISDTTEILEIDRPRLLAFHARMWPVGEAIVKMQFDPDGSGTTVTMAERPARGPGLWVDNPLLRFWLRRRNIESVARLASVAEKRRV
jgi:uncharacterized protein YndB with AHSA1/START domain